MHRFFATLLVSVGLAALSVAAKAQEAGELTVRAHGFTQAEGPVVAELFVAIGFSGGFGLSWVSGRPDSARPQCDFKPPAQTLEVRLP